MDKSETQPATDTRTPEGLLEDLRNAHTPLNAELRKLQGATRPSNGYHHALLGIADYSDNFGCSAVSPPAFSALRTAPLQEMISI